MDTKKTTEKGSGAEQTAWCRDYKGREYSYAEFLKMAEQFHGFGSPGIMFGGAMVGLALKSIKQGCLFNAVCETGKCLPDAIQILTLCSTGNAWMRVEEYGRFALTLYDKYTGEGVRVYLDASKLEAYPEFRDWFFRLKPKKVQDFDLLMKNIRDAGEKVLGMRNVKVDIERLIEGVPRKIVICPKCGEAYPESNEEMCVACGGGAYYSGE